MGENQNSQDSTRDWQWFFTFLPKAYNDPTVDTHILAEGFCKNKRKTQKNEKAYVSQNNTPGSKADFPDFF